MFTETNRKLSALQPMDPEQITRLLDIELEQKRLEWKKTSARNRAIRMNSFFALFALIAGCIVVYFVMMSRLNETRSTRPATAQASQK